MLVHLSNKPIFKLIDSENGTMLFKNYFRFEITTATTATTGIIASTTAQPLQH